MIVEDEKILVMVLENMLNEAGYKVIAVADSGESAIERARELNPGFILMDIHLKGSVDGIEAARVINNDGDIPIIYLTAHGDKKTIERALLTAPYSYLLKPFKMKDLEITIELALYRHQLESKLKESEKKFRVIFNHVTDPIVIYDLNGRILELNQAALDALGYLNDLVGEDIRNLEYSDYAELESQRIAAVLAKSPQFFENAFMTGNGSLFQVEMNCGLIDYQDRQAILAICRDASRHIEVEETLYSQIDDQNRNLAETLKRFFSMSLDGEKTAPPWRRLAARLATAIGADMNLEMPRINSLAMAALVSDIGLALNQFNLHEVIDGHEFDDPLFRLHPLLGYHILKQEPAFAAVAEIILRHEEKWDGSGYPEGLSGTAIPVEARILAVAEAIARDLADADGPPREKWAAIIESKAISHQGALDPELVRRTLNILNSNTDFYL